MRIKHYAVFKNHFKTLDWESLRNNRTEDPYFLPFTKEEYILKVDTAFPSKQAAELIKEIKEYGYNKVFSIGSGIAWQEFQIKKFSDLYVVISDFNSTVLRLKEFGIFDECFQLDALNDSVPVNESYLVIFPRIDTEFDDHQLKELFNKFHSLGVKNILFLPAELLSLRIIVSEVKTILISILKRRTRVFCGYIRSENNFIKIWEPFYTTVKKYKSEQVYYMLESR